MAIYFCKLSNVIDGAYYAEGELYDFDSNINESFFVLYEDQNSGGDRIEMLIASASTPSGLYRNAPISTLGAGKISTSARGSVESQEAFNSAVWATIQAIQGA